MTRRSFLGPAERLLLMRDGFYSPDETHRRRASVLMALDRGSTVSDAARSAHCHRTTIYRWLTNYLRDRDPAALSDNRRRYTGRPTQRRKALLARVASLVALIATQPRDTPSRLGLDDADRAKLATIVGDKSHSVRQRHTAALLWAIDLGLPISTISRAGGGDRGSVRNAPARYLARLLPKATPRAGT